VLRELRQVRQIAGESRRRCSSDPDMGLAVWTDEDGGITDFELCCDKEHTEQAVRWIKGKGFDHKRVDDGEQSPWDNLTPILVPAGMFTAKNIPALRREKPGDGSINFRFCVPQSSRVS
jgi:hypothetical protein